MRFSKTQPRFKNPIDKRFLLFLAILIIFGLLMIYDATAVLSQQITGSPYHFLLLQSLWLVLGSCVFYLCSSVNLAIVKKYSKPFFFVSVFFLAILAIAGILPCSTSFIFGPCINGANRWFYFNPAPLPALPLLGVLSFQPSEFAKLAIILYLAGVLEDNLKLSKNVFRLFVLICLGVVGLIVLQPNFSTAMLILFIASVMYFVSRAALRPALLFLPPFLILLLALMLIAPHSRSRILAQFDADKEASYHMKQISIALGSGGAFGLGLGESRQKFQYLPEVFADSIFAIVGEELGFVGTTVTIVLFFLLIHRCFLISRKSNNLYGSLIAAGVGAWTLFQFFINVGAMVRVVPLTGVPLPLVSYGGSSLIFMLAAFGLVANVSKNMSR